jgi:ssDNA-binding Zn-finger/Zn-ribbon topoisomerase 1
MVGRTRKERRLMRKDKKICPKCKKEMTEVYTAIGGFPGHPHIHPGPLWGYKCDDCGHEEKVKKQRL